MKNLFLSNRLFWLLGGIITLFVLSLPLPFLFPLTKGLLALLLTATLIDGFLLFRKNTRLTCKRISPKVLSLGDHNTVRIETENLSPLYLKCTIIDELPFQLQKRDFQITIHLLAGEKHNKIYTVFPAERGEYDFGLLHTFIESKLGLLQRRIQHPENTTIPVFPSILQMKHFQLSTFKGVAVEGGIKKIRRLGHSYEFDQIKNYVRGDDYRSINWKASSRRATLMVNQYEDERAQQVYCIIDKSRSMKLPFHGMSLMDYAINTSLVIASTALQKYDKAGLITFSDKLGTVLKAERKSNQLRKILHALYKEKERPKEADFELLYHACRKLIRGRSLLVLYTNFESQYALDRVLPILRKINKFHLLLVVFFRNTELEEFVRGSFHSTEAIYQQTIARKYIFEKEQMIQKLQRYGIQCILTQPENLTVNTINKYLELKARGYI